jgi:hypothetical protein
VFLGLKSLFVECRASEKGHFWGSWNCCLFLKGHAETLSPKRTSRFEKDPKHIQIIINKQYPSSDTIGLRARGGGEGYTGNKLL